MIFVVLTIKLSRKVEMSRLWLDARRRRKIVQCSVGPETAIEQGQNSNIGRVLHPLPCFWTQIEAKVFLHKKSCGGPRQVIAFIKNGDNLSMRELGIFISSAFLTTVLAEFSTVWYWLNIYTDVRMNKECNINSDKKLAPIPCADWILGTTYNQGKGLFSI